MSNPTSGLSLPREEGALADASVKGRYSYEEPSMNINKIDLLPFARYVNVDIGNVGVTIQGGNRWSPGTIIPQLQAHGDGDAINLQFKWATVLASKRHNTTGALLKISDFCFKR